MDGKIYKVFVSSTYEDLREERAAVQKALLRLGCLPVGMELFPAADDETWEFIKSQIDDADYYMVIVAGKYGSIAPDGTSFTEKEYDYALSKRKPGIGFVHANPGSIAADRTEIEPGQRTKLETFAQKVKRRPVRSFTNPHELASEVIISFVSLIREKPAEGYVRSSAAVEYKRYAASLEENNASKTRIRELEGYLERRLRLSYAADVTQHHGTWAQTFLRVEKEGGYNIKGAQVKLIEAKIQKDGSWRNTKIISNPNMSWASVPDANMSKKYSTYELTVPELVDFITGPLFPGPRPENMIRGLQIRFEPTHTGMSPNFLELGNYMFVVQVSAPDILPDELTLFVDWNEQSLIIRTKDAWQRII